MSAMPQRRDCAPTLPLRLLPAANEAHQEEIERSLFEWATTAVPRCLRRWGVPKDTIADIVQEACVVVVRMVKGDLGEERTPWAMPPSAARAYVLAAAWNKVQDDLRWRGRNGAALPPADLLDHGRARITGGDDLSRIEEIDLLEAAFVRLSEQEREMIVAVDLKGMSREAAAKIFGLSVSTFRRRYDVATERFHRIVRQLAGE